MLLLCFLSFFFFFNDTATTEIYTLSLHDALPILSLPSSCNLYARSLFTRPMPRPSWFRYRSTPCPAFSIICSAKAGRSEEHTSELQSLAYLVCRLLLEKKKE